MSECDTSRTSIKGRENTIIEEHLYTCVNTCLLGDYMPTKNITLKVDSELYDKYRNHCKKEGWIVSRQFEKLMEDHLELEK
jgi:hypothetical protein